MFSVIVQSELSNHLFGGEGALVQDVTPENFLAVLKGDKSKVKGGSGKVIKRQVNKSDTTNPT